MKYVSVAEMIAIEQEANALGITYEKMMENAGRSLAEVVDYTFEDLDKREKIVLGLVGSGNNGGDTLVALTHLATKGWKTTAYLVGSRPQGDPLLVRLTAQGGLIHSLHDDAQLKKLKQCLESHRIVLDGILGTGFRLPLKPELAKSMANIKKILNTIEEPPVIIAVDCPSGVDCDTGEVAPECLPATMTVTMAAIKQGLFKFPAYSYCGEVIPVQIGLPSGGEALKSWQAVRNIVPSPWMVRSLLPPRPLDAHKGTFGTALIVAGSRAYSGAALLAGRAAYRIGVGLVTMAVPEVIQLALAGVFPEATWIPLPHQNGFIAAESAQILEQYLPRIDALLIGPGFGLHPHSATFLEQFIRPDLPPVVIDADGLKLLKNIQEWHTRLPPHSILTPHPGEMSILTDLKVPEIQARRVEVAKEFSQKWGHIVVLKGAFTVIASPEGDAAIIPVATPALARAGTGDVLAGAIVGLRAQNLTAFNAAMVGAFIHAHAGLQAVKYIGNPASVVAGDVLNTIVETLNDLTQE